VLAWMVNNVTLRMDPNENIMPDKARSTGRIDGVVAAIIALAVAIKHQDDDAADEYSSIF